METKRWILFRMMCNVCLALLFGEIMWSLITLSPENITISNKPLAYSILAFMLLPQLIFHIQNLTLIKHLTGKQTQLSKKYRNWHMELAVILAIAMMLLGQQAINLYLQVKSFYNVVHFWISPITRSLFFLVCIVSANLYQVIASFYVKKYIIRMQAWQEQEWIAKMGE